MYRLALGIEYTGTNYRGWQQQINHPQLPTIQHEVEKALSIIANHQVKVVCAGRTDAGVHASAQVIHCDVNVKRQMHAWVFGCNAKLPTDIRVLWAQQVPMEFDARRSALHRRYQYILYNNPTRPSLLYDYVAWHYVQLDEHLMHAGAQAWLGKHDFTSFRGADCQSLSPIREVKAFSVKRSKDLIIFDILANAFLYHMVRNMVGTLIEIGSKRKPVPWATQVLNACDRTKAGISATPQGLYLVEVTYPELFQLPQQKAGLWFFNQG